MSRILISPLLILLVTTLINPSQQLDNGLARTPPMGFLSWLRFTCEVDCAAYPNECINEDLYKDVADRFVSDGWKELGYEYVCIDDCWSEMERDKDGNLVPDKTRFPNGIKGLADYVHSKGLKLGLYGDMGHKTCAGYPGFVDSNDNTSFFERDTKKFAEWGVDLLKVDGCFLENRTEKFPYLFTEFGKALNQTGRPILYSCEWPLYVLEEKKYDQTPWQKIADTCNIFRNYHDVESSWASITSIIDHYTMGQDAFAKVQKPGAFFDPDMLALGNYGLSHDQERVQMALWAIYSAPLLISADIRDLKIETKRLLQNKAIIEVNQDPLGKFGKRVHVEDRRFNGQFKIWAKELTGDSFAVAYVNTVPIGNPTKLSRRLKGILESLVGKDRKLASDYRVLDLFDDANQLFEISQSSNLTLKVNPTGVNFVKLVPK